MLSLDACRIRRFSHLVKQDPAHPAQSAIEESEIKTRMGFFIFHYFPKPGAKVRGPRGRKDELGCLVSDNRISPYMSLTMQESVMEKSC
jgi:hypothetical protein